MAKMPWQISARLRQTTRLIFSWGCRGFRGCAKTMEGQDKLFDQGVCESEPGSYDHFHQSPS